MQLQLKKVQCKCETTFALGPGQRALEAALAPGRAVARAGAREIPGARGASHLLDGSELEAACFVRA